ncbi:MAG: RNA polymerase sigma factor [Acidobacteriota bacterium]
MSQPTSVLPVEELLGLEVEKKDASGLSLDEVALIERCLSGDESAFDQIVGRYRDMVFNMALRLLGTREEALDLSQEVFLQIYRKLGSFRQDASLRTWIYRIVFNRAKNRQRWWRRREGEMTALAVEQIEKDPSWELSAALQRNASMAPDEILERKELGHILHKAIANLPFDQKTILLLKEIEGLSYDEIAATLSLALGTVKSRLARARKALRNQVAAEFAASQGP